MCLDQLLLGSKGMHSTGLELLGIKPSAAGFAQSHIESRG